jgi:hypothetical protein
MQNLTGSGTMIAPPLGGRSPRNATDLLMSLEQTNARPVETIDTTTGLALSGARFDDPFAMTASVYLIETAPVSARITTQRGIFTVQGV